MTDSKKKFRAKQIGCLAQLRRLLVRTIVIVVLLAASAYVLKDRIQKTSLPEWYEGARDALTSDSEPPRDQKTTLEVTEDGVRSSDGSIILTRKKPKSPHLRVSETIALNSSDVPFPRNVFSSVVLLRTFKGEARIQADGTQVQDFEVATGFIVARDRHSALIATARHAIRGGLPQVVLAGSNESFPAEVWRESERWDIALLRVSNRILGSDHQPLDLGGSETHKDKESVWIAAALGVSEARRPPFLNARRRTPDARTRKLIAERYGWHRLDGWSVFSPQLPTYEGYSGAPLIAPSGRVVGMLIAEIQQPDGVQESLVVNADVLVTFLDDL